MGVSVVSEDFRKWLYGLNEEAKRHEMKNFDWQETGADCWLEYFSDGLTPAEALKEDLANG